MRESDDLRLNSAAWENSTLTPSDDRVAAVLDELGAARMARSITVHEAGHAVVGLATGHTVEGMWLTGNGLNHAATEWSGSADLAAHLAMTVAGLRAQTRWLTRIGASRPVLEWAWRRSLLDRQYLHDLTTRHGLPRAPSMYTVERRAEQLLDQHWPAVYELAVRLDFEHNVTGDTIRSVAAL